MDPARSSSSTADTPTVPGEGEVLGGKYRVEELLGQGGMGVVLAARHEVLGHRVAIKVLTSAARANATSLARFLREARATLDLKSEHVVRVLDEGTTAEGAPYLVMEHLEGEDLHRVLARRGPLPVEEAVDYVLEACDAMAEAHARGIVHRDLKPSNLFLTRRADGRALVKVLDFGISKLAIEEGESELTETRAILGSPGYMAPEQIRSARHADHRADVWGLGIVLFRLLTRSPAFEGEGAMGICAAILRDEPKKLREVRPDAPAELEEVIARCLRKDPVERWPDVGELARALVPFAPDSPTAARFRRGARGEASSASRTPLASEPSTPAAVTASPRPSTRSVWPIVAALSAAAVVAVVLARGAPAGPSASEPKETNSIEPSAAPPPKASAPATSSEAPDPPAIASAAEGATAAPSHAAAPHPSSTKKPPKPKVKGNGLGSVIDDPL